MKTYKIFRAGNSNVVALDPQLEERFNMGLGLQVVQYPSDEGILIKPLKKSMGIPGDLRAWLAKFEGKHGRALHKLAQK